MSKYTVYMQLYGCVDTDIHQCVKRVYFPHYAGLK